jgi:hypothetical protein
VKNQKNRFYEKQAAEFPEKHERFNRVAFMQRIASKVLRTFHAAMNLPKYMTGRCSFLRAQQAFCCVYPS